MKRIQHMIFIYAVCSTVIMVYVWFSKRGEITGAPLLKSKEYSLIVTAEKQITLIRDADSKVLMMLDAEALLDPDTIEDFIVWLIE